MSKSIRLGRGKDARIFSRRTGRWSISNGGFDGYYRHEIGHAVHHGMLGTSSESQWSNMYWDRSLDWWKKNVSEYSTTNHREGFAECFSLYTDPLYGSSKQWKLPKVIEKFFDGILKKEGVF